MQNGERDRQVRPSGSASAGRQRGAARRLGDLTSKVLDPIVARRAGMTADLLAAWPQMCGKRHAAYSRPERIKWPRRASEDDPFEPGVLIVACDGAGSVLLQHESDEILRRVNAYFGFQAVSKLRILQKPVAATGSIRQKSAAPLNKKSRQRLDALLETIEDEALRERIERWGEGALAKAASRRSGSEK